VPWLRDEGRVGAQAGDEMDRGDGNEMRAVSVCVA